MSGRVKLIDDAGNQKIVSIADLPEDVRKVAHAGAIIHIGKDVFSCPDSYSGKVIEGTTEERPIERFRVGLFETLNAGDVFFSEHFLEDGGTEVFIDGKRLDDCACASEKEGWAECFVRDSSGHFKKTFPSGEILRDRTYGKVSIRGVDAEAKQRILKARQDIIEKEARALFESRGPGYNVTLEFDNEKAEYWLVLEPLQETRIEGVIQERPDDAHPGEQMESLTVLVSNRFDLSGLGAKIRVHPDWLQPHFVDGVLQSVSIKPGAKVDDQLIKEIGDTLRSSRSRVVDAAGVSENLSAILKPITWTSDPPTESEWYWISPSGSMKDAEIVYIVRVVQEKQGTRVDIQGLENEQRLRSWEDVGCLWAGPIPPPSMPENTTK